MYKYQSGYRKMYSTQTALIRVLDDIRKAIDTRRLTVLMLLDFSRAFDCVNHVLLVSILKSYNFSKASVAWFGSYLYNRRQQIKTHGGSTSSWKVNSIGVPQGSTLSALLFSLYINRISSNVMFCNTMLYADDMQMYISCDLSKINDAINGLNTDLRTVHTMV